MYRRGRVNWKKHLLINFKTQSDLHAFLINILINIVINLFN